MNLLTLAQANTIIAAALAKARQMNLPPLGVAVLDPGGHLVALQREDGLSFVRVKVCQAKAYGALATGVHSRHIASRYREGVNQEGFVNALNDLTGGNIIPLPGGVIIREAGGGILGAVGISGASSEEDEACAVAGIEAAGYSVNLNDKVK